VVCPGWRQWALLELASSTSCSLWIGSCGFRSHIMFLGTPVGVFFLGLIEAKLGLFISTLTTRNQKELLLLLAWRFFSRDFDSYPNCLYHLRNKTR
jgi:hypothetical protein